MLTMAAHAQAIVVSLDARATPPTAEHTDPVPAPIVDTPALVEAPFLGVDNAVIPAASAPRDTIST
jgi:hypothetical protein